MRTILFTSCLLFVISCSQNSESKSTKREEQRIEQSDQKEAYVCPMKCEEGKTYESEGACPVCGMDLEKVKN